MLPPPLRCIGSSHFRRHFGEDFLKIEVGGVPIGLEKVLVSLSGGGGSLLVLRVHRSVMGGWVGGGR